MKTPISILDQFFGAAVRLARRLGISSSGLYSNAVSQLIDENHSLGARERLDAVYAADSESSRICFKVRKGDAYDVEIVDYHRG